MEQYCFQKQTHALLEQKIKERTDDYKKAKDEDEDEAANRLKNEFLANISHELRTPMHHILSYSKIGISKFETASRKKLSHCFSQIRHSGSHLLFLLNDLLDLSKLESGQITYTIESNELDSLVKTAVSEFKPAADEKSITIDLTNSNLDTTVKCDRDKIYQVIYNLLSNAVKYSPENKSISIFFSRVTQEPTSNSTHVYRLYLKTNNLPSLSA